MKRLRTGMAFGALVAVVAASGQGVTAFAAPSPAQDKAQGTGLSTSYIVTLDSGTPRGVAALAEAFGGQTGHVYENAIKGFSMKLPAALLPRLLALPGVASVEKDDVVTATATQTPTPSWGLDRVDQRALPLNNSFTYTAQGAVVKAYIIDTGIQRNHTDFGGRAIFGFDSVDGTGLLQDCNGHGTHVSGTVGGTKYGIAKAVTLVAVRVLDCAGSGLNSGVIAGVDWVTGNHAAGAPAVANMSLGGGVSDALDNAVKGAIADGVTFALAAGNDSGASACNGSPGRTAEALTVGATDFNDARASYSNIGTCVDLFAPGSSITSSWMSATSTTATNTISGTSMATPHVAGVAALYLSTSPGATPAQVAAQLTSTATAGAVTSAGTGSPNRLLFTSY